MVSYETPAGFEPMSMAEAFAREGDGRVADTQAATLVALGAELAGEQATLSIMEAGKTVKTRAPAEVPPQIRQRLELPPVPVERWQATRGLASQRLERDYGRLCRAEAPGIAASDAEPYQELYQRLEQRPGQTRANDLIEACLGHPNLQTRVGAAAAHLLRGRRLTGDLRAILEEGLKSRVSLARGIGAASLARFDPTNPLLAALSPPPPEGGQGEPARTSVVVHGTFAAGNDWWQPQGDFHEYLRTGPRPDVYGAEDRFRWSGGFSDEARSAGADRLKAWLDAKQAARADLFAHSHGGSISMLATQRGLTLRKLVLLSCPVMERYFADFDRVEAVYSIRVWFDPVILIAGGGQRFPDHLPITEEILPGFDHSASHYARTWVDRQLDQLIGPVR